MNLRNNFILPQSYADIYKMDIIRTHKPLTVLFLLTFDGTVCMYTHYLPLYQHSHAPLYSPNSHRYPVTKISPKRTGYAQKLVTVLSKR